VNVTFSENAATEEGGAFYSQSVASFTGIVFSTFYANTAGARGSAIFDETGSTRVKNSVVVGSGAASNCFGVFSSRGRNYSTDESCPGFTVAAPDALRLGPLADNGGPTETHALLSGSVAIDSAPDCNDLEGGAITSDQRGAPRPWGASCDVGAYEAGAPVTPFGPTRTPTPTFLSRSRTPTETVTATPRPTCPGDCGGDGQVTIDELVTMVNIALGAKPVSECSVSDTSGDGEITIDEIIQAVNRALNGC
jgi:predicted outer membrane repeat protein